MGLIRKHADPFLPDGDYLPVAMPTTDVAVLQVLAGHGGVLRRFSTLDQVLRHDADISRITIKRDEPVANVKGAAKSQAKIGLGVSIVASLIQALGGGQVGAELEATGAKAIKFGYDDVVADRVDMASLDLWLADADFNSKSRAIADLLAAESMYAVVGALKAGAISVTLLDSEGGSVKVDLPTIADAVGGNVSVTSSRESTAALTFTGDQSLVIAAKAARIKTDFEQGFWADDRLATKGEIRGLGRSESVTWLRTANGTLDLE